MKHFKSTVGPFRERPWYELEEIDRICTEELQNAGLYPKEPGAVRIERFLEKRFGLSPRYEDLGGKILGYTRFGATGAPEEIVISRVLAESGTRGADCVLNSTMAHEAGHILLHGHLFALDGTSSLFENVEEPNKILCRDSEVDGASDRRRAYDGRWYEFQANRAIGGLLLPRALTLRCIEDFTEQEGKLGLRTLPETRREAAVGRIAEVFEVNPVVARIRVDGLFSVGRTGQLTL